MAKKTKTKKPAAKPKKSGKLKTPESEKEKRARMLKEWGKVYDEEETKDEKKIIKDRMGRPTVMTKQVLSKLKDAFAIGCTDEEACIYADISTPTFYRFCQADEDFREEKERLKEKPVIAARLNIVNAINSGSKSDAWEYLRRKRKKEFSESKEVVINAVTPEEMSKMGDGDVVVIDE